MFVIGSLSALPVDKTPLHVTPYHFRVLLNMWPMTWRSSRKEPLFAFSPNVWSNTRSEVIVHVWYTLLQKQWVKQLSVVYQDLCIIFFINKANSVKLSDLYNTCSCLFSGKCWLVPKFLWTFFKDCIYSNTEHKKYQYFSFTIFFFTLVNL